MSTHTLGPLPFDHKRSIMDRSPSIAAIGVTGRHNNPLHISLFPATGGSYEAERDNLEYSMMLNSCLDIFEARMPGKTVGHDFGLLHALDERIAMYGWLLNTGVKLVIVVDMEGRTAPNSEAAKTAILGLRNSDLTPVSGPSGMRSAVANATFADVCRLSKHYKQLTFAYCEIRSMCQMITTQGQREVVEISRSIAQDSSRTLRGLDRTGIPESPRCERLSMTMRNFMARHARCTASAW